MYRDTVAAEKTLQKIQVLMQKRDLKSYIQEFNTLYRLVRKTMMMSDNIMLYYFTQGLVKYFCIAIATTILKDLTIVQTDVCCIDLVL
jgi:hypothetical protein